MLDRGYVGNTMAATLAQHGMAFCLRVDASGWRCVADFRRSNEAERVVTLSPPTARDASTFDLARTATTVRLIRNIAPNGQIRVLMTNLLDAQSYPAAQFSALYHQRWRVEEAFKRIKHRLRLEATTGLNYLALQQDFAAKILADNLCALLSGSGTDDAIQTGSRPNRTYAFGALKPILAGCLLGIAQAWAALPDSGFDKIFEVLLSQGRPAPELIETHERVQVTVRRRILKPEVIDFIAKADQTYQLTQRERIALGLLAQHDALTARELVTSLELPSVEALQPWLKRLLDWQLVQSAGRTQATRYFVDPSLLRSLQFTGETHSSALSRTAWPRWYWKTCSATPGRPSATSISASAAKSIPSKSSARWKS